MKTIKKTAGAIALSLALAALPSVYIWGGPTGAHNGALLSTGQTPVREESNGLFNRDVNATFGNEAFGGVTLNGYSHDNFEVTPLCGGLAVLLAAGAGYAALKRRKEEHK